MKAIATAIFARMAADATLTALLGTTNAVASIFAKRPVPTGAGHPLVLASATVSDIDEDLLATSARSLSRDIMVVGKGEGQFDKVDAASLRIRALFHRQRLTATGVQVFSIRAVGPIDAPADPGEFARLVTLTLRYRTI